MKYVWSCRRTFLAIVSIVGLLHIMDKKDKDFALEICGLAGGVAFINAWQNKGKPDDSKPHA